MELTITLAALGVLLISSYGLKYFNIVTPKYSRYKTVFGFRGFLAFIIFLYHSVIWYGYLKTGKWEWEDTTIYVVRDCVISFFLMVTGFLFFSRLAEKKNKEMDWRVYFKSRFFRLCPVYFFSVTVMIIIVLAASDFRLYKSLGRNVEDLLKWYTFTLFGTPNINKFKNTYLIIAGVQWIFIYEWIFYFFLPWAAFLFYRIHVPKALLFLCGALVLTFCIKNGPGVFFLMAFLSGLLASILNNNLQFVKWARHNFSSFVILVCFGGIITLSQKFNIVPFILATIIFCLIACGNSFFGILQTRIAGLLGRISYSLFLIHGIVLYVTMNFIIGAEKAKSLSAREYSMVITSCILPLLLITSMIYYWVEVKFIAKGHEVKDKIKTTVPA